MIRPLGVGCASCGAGLPAGARFCPACGEEAAGFEPGGVVKLATVVFADLTGYTAWSQDRPPDEVRELLTAYLRDLAAEVTAHGGTVDKFTGDGIMADFGVPTARDDDAVRAVRAALGMQRRAATWSAAHDEPLQLRVGVNSGEVSTGGPLGREVLVLGSTVNVAARLQSAATPGDVLVSERTAGLVARSFVLRPVSPLELKGVTGPLRAFVVAGDKEPGSASARRFVGRRRELALLEERWGAWCNDGASQLHVVVGDAGVGKSRLVEELALRLGGTAPMVSGRCRPDMQLAAAWPLRAALCSLVDVDPAASSGDLAEAAGDLAARWSLGDDLRAGLTVLLCEGDGAGVADPLRAQALLHHGWLGAARALAEERAILVVEDLQWADATTAELLTAMVGEPGPMVIATARPELDPAAGPPGSEVVRLEPLTGEESEALIASLAPGLETEVARQINQRAAGNPFFVEEAVARFIDGVRAVVDGVPDTVRAVLHARLDQLSPPAHAVLQAAAVCGRRCAPPQLAGLAPSGIDVAGTLEELRRFDLLVPEEAPSGHLAFRHELVREVAYERTPRRHRGRLHRRLAEELERSPAPPPALVAHHWLAAWDQSGDAEIGLAAGRASLVGARHAYRLHAVVEGRALAERAVALLRDTAWEAEALEVAGDLAAIASEGDRAWSAFVAALQAASDCGGGQDGATVARVAAKASLRATRWAGTMFRPPPPEEVAALIDRGLAAAGRADGSDRAQLLAARAFLLGAVQGDLSPAARRWAEEAVAMAERLDDANLLSISLDALNVWCTGRLGEAYRLIGRRLDLVPRLDVAEAGDAFAMAAWTAAVIGRHAEATAHATQCIRLARGSDPSTLMAGLAWRVVTRCGSGDWDGAMADLAEIEQLAVELHHDLPPPSTTMAHGAAALIAARRSDVAEVARVTELLDRSRKARPEGATRGRQAHLARAWVALGDLDRAASLICDDDGDFAPLNLQARCELVAAAGSWEDAPALIARSRRLVEESELEALDAAVDHLAGLAALAAGDPGEARRFFERAATGWANLPAPWEQAATLGALAGAERLMGRGAEARRHEAVAARLRSRLVGRPGLR